MTIAQIFSTSIAFISLLISITVAYLAYFKPSQIKMLPGRILIITNSYLDTESERVWGGLSLILPFTFSNWSPKGSSISQIKLVIERKDNANKSFEITWNGFVTFMNGGRQWESDEIAYPIAIKAQSSLTKFVRFDWSPLKGEKIEVREGEYNLRIYAWIKSEQKPDMKEIITFYLDKEEEAIYQKSVEKNLAIPIYINLGQSSLPNQVMTRQEIMSKYE